MFFLLFICLPCKSEIENQFLGFGKVLRGSWYNPETTGQGLLIDYDNESQLIYAGWFTFLPETSKRIWFSLLGLSGSNVHHLEIILSTDGVFNSNEPVTNTSIGTAELTFLDCNHAKLDYDFSNKSGSGSIDLQRIVSVNESLCDELILVKEVPYLEGDDKVIVFKDVNLLAMNGDGIQWRQSIKIENGVIKKIDDFSNIMISDETVVIDGRGRYLIPGLADMHTHLATNVREFMGLSAPMDLIQTSAENQLILYLANGVTTILNNGDFGEPLPTWANDVHSNTLIGPTIYSAKYARGGSGTCDNGPPNATVSTPAQARLFVVQAKSDGYDFIKTYNCTPASALIEILSISTEIQMPVIGHLPQTLSVQQTLNQGMVMVAHAEAYVWTLFNFQHLISQFPLAISLTESNDTRVTGTLSILNLIAQVWGNNTQGIEAYWNMPEIRYMHPTTRSLNNRSINSNRFNPQGSNPGGYNPRRDFVFLFSKALHEAGIKLLMGTDSPTVMGVPGFSAFHEMLALNSTGISNTDVLKISTKNAGDFINQHLPDSEPFGSIEIGSRADLILISTNPLDNLDFKDDILGVMARGHWYSKKFLDEKLEAIAVSYGN